MALYPLETAVDTLKRVQSLLWRAGLVCVLDGSTLRVRPDNVFNPTVVQLFKFGGVFKIARPGFRNKQIACDACPHRIAAAVFTMMIAEEKD